MRRRKKNRNKIVHRQMALDCYRNETVSSFHHHNSCYSLPSDPSHPSFRSLLDLYSGTKCTFAMFVRNYTH
jgi:hypothetical protein